MRKASRNYLYTDPLFSLDDFAVLVVTTVRAYTVRKLHLSALRAYAARRRIDAVVRGPAGMGADATHSLFRYCHL